MSVTKAFDPFLSIEAEVEVDAETSRILRQREATAREGRLVSEEEARRRIKRWLSKSSTTKTR
jgi:hypothetical protein